MITYKDKADKTDKTDKTFKTFNSWSDVVTAYPAKWVVFDKAEVKHGRIETGSILTILPDEEIIKFENENAGNYVLSLRTTEDPRDWGGLR